LAPGLVASFVKGSVVLITISALAGGGAASGSGLQNRPWTIPVAEGTRVIEHEAVSPVWRAARIELVEDLTIGVGSTDPNYMFYQARDIAVDAEGNIYLLDGGNHRVQVFDPDGRFSRSFGREGQGPGEFMQPLATALLGERLFVADNSNQRVSVWTLTGELVEDRAAPFRGMSIGSLAALTGGSLLFAHDSRLVPESSVGIARLSATGSIEERYIERSQKRAIMRKERAAGGTSAFMLPGPNPTLAAGSDGNAYLTNGDEYQVLALDGTGRGRWALRVDAERRAFSEAYVEEMFRAANERGANVAASEFDDWRPDYFPVIDTLQVDGRGRLWVFPYAQFAGPPPPAEVPVDIYSPAGDRLFSGTAARQRWKAAHGDFVYAIETDRASDEQKIVRYRIEWPRR
jgi:hypothetical protein